MCDLINVIWTESEIKSEFSSLSLSPRYIFYSTLPSKQRRTSKRLDEIFYYFSGTSIYSCCRFRYLEWVELCVVIAKEREREMRGWYFWLLRGYYMLSSQGDADFLLIEMARFVVERAREEIWRMEKNLKVFSIKFHWRLRGEEVGAWSLDITLGRGSLRTFYLFFDFFQWSFESLRIPKNWSIIYLRSFCQTI